MSRCFDEKKIVVGRYYVTMSGEKVRIYAKDGAEGSIHGAIFHNGAWWSMAWCKNGQADDRIIMGINDIIGFWRNRKSPKEEGVCT